MAIWELAPGSPWNAIFIGLVMVCDPGRLVAAAQLFASICAGGFEVGRRVDAARHGVDDGDVDPHAGLQRAELFELLLLLQRRGRQRDEALQRRAAIGVEADMMVARPVAVGRGGAGEIQRAQPARADRRADRLHHVRVRCAPPRCGFRRPASRYRPRDRPAGPARRGYCRADGRKIALQIDDDLGRAVRDRACPAPRRSGPSRTGGRRGSSPPRRHGPSPPPRSPAVSVATATRPISAASARRSTWTIIGRPAMSSSGLPGRRRGGHAGGNQHQSAGFGHRREGHGTPVDNRPEMMGIGRKSAHLYGLPEHGQTDI